MEISILDKDDKVIVELNPAALLTYYCLTQGIAILEGTYYCKVETTSGIYREKFEVEHQD